ncbi:30S ribosomal protein S3Ae [uncultured archaeon]|nr:30S ribosomal protein S3Ae [uncultured archaeon]
MVEIMQQPGETKKTDTSAKPKAGKDTWSKKSWYAVSMPDVFGSDVIAEVPSLKESALIGRIINVSLSELTKNYKHMHTTVKLKITGLDGKKAKTEYAGQELLKDSLARLIRRWSSRVDSIQDIQLKDKKMRLKMVIITAKKANTSIRETLRALTIKTAGEMLGNKTRDEAVMDINTEKLQRAIHESASKIFPVRSVEVRKVEVK